VLPPEDPFVLLLVAPGPPVPTFPDTVPPGVTGNAEASNIPPAPPPPPIVFPPPPPPPIARSLTDVTPAGTLNENPPVDVNDVITGALTVILNDLVAV
jgi:hypothetical protein